MPSMAASTVEICVLMLAGARVSNFRPRRKPTSVAATIKTKKTHWTTHSFVR